MRWTAVIATLSLVVGCQHPIQSNVGYDELIDEYRASFVADGDTLKVQVSNPGGLNIVSLSSFSRDGDLFVGAARASSGPRQWQWVSLDVSQHGLGPGWHERVYWWFGDEQNKVQVSLSNGQPK